MATFTQKNSKTSIYKRKTIKVFLILLLFLPSFYFLFLYIGQKKYFVYFSISDSLFKGFAIKSINQDIKENNLVRFKNPNKELSMHKSDFLIKKVKSIENNKLYVIGRTEEDLFNQYHIKGLKSYDSSTFGLIDKKDCIKVKELKLTNKILKSLKII